jgi:peptidoglycan/xylan/chitin deacetylase (PgdA/CDA1 family)
MYVLMYHEVTKGIPEEIHGVSVERFAEQMRWLAESGYDVLTLDSWLAQSGHKDRRLWRNTVAITFDDGYLDNYENAWPILQQHNFSATIFLIAGLMGQTSRWRPGALRESRLLSWQQARELADHEVALGGHTLTHPNLTALAAAEVEHELTQSRDLLEQNLSRSIKTFSYPYSGVNPTVKTLVAQAGYKLACSCPTGYVGQAGVDLFDLQRITVLASDTLSDFQQKIQGTLRRHLRWQYMRFGTWRRHLLKRSLN